MKVASAFTLLSVAAIVSATKLQSAYTQLCLDAFNGLSNGSRLYMGPCDQVKHGNWQILQSGDRVWLTNNEDKGANGGQGWCVDYNPSRYANPTVWACNGSDSQRFIRDQGTKQDKWSFMTVNAIDQWGRYELSSRDSNLGSEANFSPETATSGNQNGANYEWNYIA
ncbi:hypothetical protein BGX28_003295 [Mortierella sp. GBA30]|nr:hypothetical protein BGX28_003295 [Mortierella sp. GBA30]